MATTELTGAEDVAWDLSDLYDGGDDPRIEQDVEQTEAAAAAFRERYYGGVADLSAGGAARRDRGARADRVDLHARDLLRAPLVRDGHERLAARRARRAAHGEGRGDRHAAPLLRARARRRSRTSRPTPCSRASELEHWRHWLRTVRKFRPYVLTEPEEKILTEKSVSGFSAWDRLYDELLGAIKVELDGTEIGFEEAMAKLYSADRDERRGASEAVTVVARPRAAHAHVHLQHDRRRQVDRRPAARLRDLDQRAQPLERHDRRGRAGAHRRGRRALRRRPALLHAQGEAARARPARLLRPHGAARRGHDAGPVGRGAAARRSSAFADFSTETGDIVERFFAESWIDAPPRDGKRPGAFCATNVPGVHPYVFMNYTGDRRSVLTLAHELGHGLHGYLAQPLGLFNASTPLTTAETASVFGEALTFKRLLAIEEDPRRRLNLLAGRIEDSIATVFRQIAMNRFEDAVHT